MVDIQSATEKIRRGKKKMKERRQNQIKLQGILLEEKPQDKNIMSVSATQVDHKKHQAIPQYLI